MLQEAVFHQPYGAYAYGIDVDKARITLRAKRGDLLAVYLAHEDRYLRPNTYETLAMEYRGSDENYDYFQADVQQGTRRFRYRFLLDDGVKKTWFAETGFSQHAEGAGWFQLAYLANRDRFQVPEWVKEAVVYQIFPDRFHNGDPTNDPEGVLPWGELPTATTFFGGDIAGITEKMPYLQDLGVNLLYLTPIFLSPSTHKYDTIDYLQVDPMFGDLAAVKKMIDEAHRRGLRVVFDAVFNHCGAQFPPFQDVVKNGEQSKYKDWFHIDSYPIDMENPNYETFANWVSQMPKLRTENPEVKAYLLQVAEFWIKEAGIDGWRLDVANEVDHAFWREFREVVRAAKADALIIGEVWHDATPWLQGDQWDGVTNYLFREAVSNFFAKRTIDVEAFDGYLTSTRMRYKEQANRAMFNLLGSHDTERFLTMCKEREELMKLAVTFQMTYVGIPQVYYGDEVGMVGENDPDCRRTMIWDEEQQNQGMLSLHKKLIGLRKQHSAIQTGRFRTVYKDALTNVYGYLREDEHEQIYVLLNNSQRDHSVSLPAGVKGTDLLTGEAHAGSFSLEAFGVRVLLIEEGHL